MRIKRNYFAVLQNSWAWIVSRFKPLTVHTEAVMFDNVWGKIKEHVDKKDIEKWYIMTPANYDYFKAYFNVKVSKKELEKVMKQRYLWMIKNKQKLELHVHFSMIMENIDIGEQEKLLKESIDWIQKELGIKVKEFVPGWWSYDENTLKLLKKYGLKLIKPKDYDFTHDFHWVL